MMKELDFEHHDDFNLITGFCMSGGHKLAEPSDTKRSYKHYLKILSIEQSPDAIQHRMSRLKIDLRNDPDTFYIN